MKSIIKKIVGKIFGKSRKFFPVVNEKGIAPKFFSITEKEYLLQQRRKGCYGNGSCSEKDF